jgi:RNA-directed DNA polymerase
MFDRALQALVKLALEPEWEAKFAPERFGFRPGRSLHEAMSAIWQALHLKPKYVLDADICQCFDGINQQKLLDKVGTFPTLTRLLKSWLRAGVMDQGRLFPTATGVPQGGVASPLFANIALWGLATHIKESFPRSIRRHGKQLQPWQPQGVIYADDFVILHQDRDVIQQGQHKAPQWLQEIGLALHPSTTRMGHSLTAVDGRIGFEFLGFHLRQYPRGKYTSGKTPHGVSLGHPTLIKPSKESIQRHYRRVVEIVEQHKSAPQEGRIGKLNPVIRGWCNHYSRAVSSQSFSQRKDRLYSKLRHWARRRHPHKSRRWIAAKYWLLHQGKGWRFGTKDGVGLLNHTEVPIVRHVKIKGRATPFDGNLDILESKEKTSPHHTEESGQSASSAAGPMPSLWAVLHTRGPG